MNTTSWRNKQLQWYGGDTLIQDAELLAFINHRNINRIRYDGDYGYLRELIGHQVDSNYDMCIYIVNSPFDFTHIANTCVDLIKSINCGGFLYLAINKFLAAAESNANIIEEDYDKCILNFICNAVTYPLVQYHSGEIDGGQKFNWAHPITRFYFQNVNN